MSAPDGPILIAFDGAAAARQAVTDAERIAGEGAEPARSLGLDAQPIAMSDGGDVAATILEVAREHEAAAIVVGSRGLNGLRPRLEGSTSNGVMKRASCPVLIVHEHGDHD